MNEKQTGKPLSNDRQALYSLFILCVVLIGMYALQSYRLDKATKENNYPSSVWISCNPYNLVKLNQTECTATIGIGNQTIHINSTYDINIYK